MHSSNMHSSFAHSFVCATYANGTSPASASIATAAAAHTRAYPFRRCRSAVPSMPRALYEYVRHQLASCDIARGDNVGGDQYILYQQQKPLRVINHDPHTHTVYISMVSSIHYSYTLNSSHFTNILVPTTTYYTRDYTTTTEYTTVPAVVVCLQLNVPTTTHNHLHALRRRRRATRGPPPASPPPLQETSHSYTSTGH